MKSEALLYALTDIDEGLIAEAAPQSLAAGKGAPRRVRKRLLLAAAAALLVLAACAAAFRLFNIPFPFSGRGRTSCNAAVYDVAPFRVEVQLPSGWTLQERADAQSFNDHVALSGMWSVLDIVDDKQELAGAIGYNTYEKYEGAEDLPAAIYSQIALGNDYHFDVRDSYRVVKTSPCGTTALADVYYSAVVSGTTTEKTNRGIVSYDRDLSVYIAAEFAGGRLDEGQLEAIAQSIRFVAK